MHIADIERGSLGANGIVGGGPPIAVGAAFAAKYQKRGGVAVCFSGDGSTNRLPLRDAALNPQRSKIVLDVLLVPRLCRLIQCKVNPCLPSLLFAAHTPNVIRRNSAVGESSSCERRKSSFLCSAC